MVNILSSVIGDSNYEANFPHKLLLTDTQVSRICSLANVKFSKTQLSKIVHLG